MALPSQHARPQSRRHYTYRRRSALRGRRRPVLIVLGGLLVLTLIVWRFSGPQTGDAAGERADSSSVANTAPIMNVDDHALAAAQDERNTSSQASAARNDPSAHDALEEEATIEMGSGTPLVSGGHDEEEAPSTTDDTASPEPKTPPLAREVQPREAEAPSIAPHLRERARERMRAGLDLLRTNKPFEARRILTRALDTEALLADEAEEVRAELAALNDRLVFSPEIASGDHFTYGYTIRQGDSLSRIPGNENLTVDWRLLQRINRISRPERIRAGQKIKLVTGPFHAVVFKREFRMDVYLGEGDDRVFVRSFPVGLGEYNSTPVGTFRVRPRSKLMNPEWVNPRTGERFLPDDPKNPIGERWIGLQGITEAVRDLGGYGIHGTIEPDSIGREASMGCIRMRAGDVELVYEMLVEGESIIEIRE